MYYEHPYYAYVLETIIFKSQYHFSFFFTESNVNIWIATIKASH